MGERSRSYPDCHEPQREQAKVSLQRHSLSDVNRDAQTAVCAICGPTAIRVRVGGRAGSECKGAMRAREAQRPPRVRRRTAANARTSMRGMSAAAKLGLLVDRSGGPDACWPWLGNTDRHGYGRLPFGSKRGLAHRVAYELAIGAIPDGQQLDHTCHTNDKACLGGSTCPHRRCVNPAHLEPVTSVENTRRGGALGNGLAAVNRRKTECKHGHPFDAANTRYRPGGRTCRACARRSANAHLERKRQAQHLRA